MIEKKTARERIKREKAQAEESRPRTERVVVSVPNYHKNLESTLNFEWPEFTSEMERIRANTKRFAEMSIPEVFGVKMVGVDTTKYDVLRELKVGDRIPVVVRSITENGVLFETVSTKQIIQSSANLKKYIKLRMITPFSADAVVVKADREIAYIDILKPMYETWLGAILKDPDLQRDMTEDKSIIVKNLQLTRGGFIGQAVIPSISEFVGQDYTVDAFIPGSQIVLNIENNFEKWNGSAVKAFVTNYMVKPGSKNEMSLVCSRKDVLKFEGDKNTIALFGKFCDGGEEWKKVAEKKYDGVVTGIINSSKKCGVFVEVPYLSITGMVELDADQLVNYKPQQEVKVKLHEFEENTYYDPMTQQLKHDLPYVVEDNVLRSCDVKPIFKLV